MSSTTFSAGTVIPVAWLNEVNALLWGSASPPATPIRVDTSGNVGVNTSTPDTSGGKTLHVYNNTNTSTASDNSTIRVESVNRNANLQARTSSATGSCSFQAYGSAGTLLGQLIYQVSSTQWQLQLSSGTTIWTANSTGFGIGGSPLGKFWVQNTASGLLVTEDVDGIALVGGYSQSGTAKAIRFAGSSGLYLSGNGANVNHITLSSSGDLTSSGGLIGYGTGAGNSVTQATSKSTAVTINSVSGAITLNNAALAASTNVGFTVNNTKVASTDVIIVNLGGGFASVGTYNVWVDDVSTGTFRIVVRNISGGSLSEAVRINFAVIKGSYT